MQRTISTESRAGTRGSPSSQEAGQRPRVCLGAHSGALPHHPGPSSADTPPALPTCCTSNLQPELSLTPKASPRGAAAWAHPGLAIPPHPCPPGPVCLRCLGLGQPPSKRGCSRARGARGGDRMGLEWKAHPEASCSTAQCRPCLCAGRSPGKPGPPSGCSSSGGPAARLAPGKSAAVSGSGRNTALQGEDSPVSGRHLPG